MNDFEFFPLKDYEGLYSINKAGQIRCEKKKKGRTYDNDVPQKIMRLKKTNSGRLSVKLMKEGVGKHVFVHRIVAFQFIPNSENKPHINHIDGNPLNNHVENLEWCTPAENVQHAYRTGLMKSVSGKDKPQSKPIIQKDLSGSVLTEWDSISQAAKHYGYSKGNIIKCCKGSATQMYGYKWAYA